MGQAADTTGAMLDLIYGFRPSQLIHLAAQLGVADLLAKGPLTAEALAQATQTQSEALYRALRALSSLGVFEELDGRRFALTPLSERLQTTQPDSLRPVALFAGAEMYRAYGDLPYSVTTGKTAFDHVFGLGHFAYLAEHPQANEVFNQVMSRRAGLEAPAVVEAYDFGGARTVVDVAGGQGLLLATILRAHPMLRGVLFDQPHVVTGAEPILRAAGVMERCEVVSGDFFASVPAGGDIYTLRQIIHDWDDERAIVILRNCAQAMAPQGRVALVEIVMGQGSAQRGPQRGAYLDITMMVMNGGRERTAEEYVRLFSAAGLRLTRIVPTTENASVIEAERV